jgi:hypothetical protein
MSKRKNDFAYDKIDFQASITAKNKEEHFIRIKGTIQKGDISILNVHAHNNKFQIHEK